VIRHKGAAFVEVFQAIVELEADRRQANQSGLHDQQVAIGEKSR
jgi:hypothetical protein